MFKISMCQLEKDTKLQINHKVAEELTFKEYEKYRIGLDHNFGHNGKVEFKEKEIYS